MGRVKKDQTPSETPSGSFIQVDENEWKALLEELAKFQKKYELILSKLDGAENRLRELQELGKQATCSYCGFKNARSARFCRRCGAGLGTFACSCGRELASTDKFCDRCGKAVREGR
jgi:ribosomal protein L40E